MLRDNLFGQKQETIEDFDFGKETAAVFDDMLVRSVPFYGELQRMMGEMAADFAVEGTSLYDLGCSTCATFLELDPVIPRNVRFVGVDFSSEMLERGKEKLSQHDFSRDHELICADLNENVPVENASVVIMNLTLQFIRPVRRNQVMRTIAAGTKKGGCLLVIDKVLSRDSQFNRAFIKYYYAFKRRNGYSELEIAQKREALENVLIPYRLEENFELFLDSGFSQCEVFFRWYNFCGMIATK